MSRRTLTPAAGGRLSFRSPCQKRRVLCDGALQELLGEETCVFALCFGVKLGPQPGVILGTAELEESVAVVLR